MSLDDAMKSLGMTRDELVKRCVTDLNEWGVMDTTTGRGSQITAEDMKAGEVEVGDLVAIYAHQRIRAARVWKVGRKNVSAVYLAPSHLEDHRRHGYPLYPNNITGEPWKLLAKKGVE